MLMKIKSKKAIAPLFIILGVVLVLIAIYIFLFIPIPAFTSLRTIINYFLILIFFVILQIGIIFGYYNLGKYAIKGLTIAKTKIANWSLDIRHLIIRSS